MRIIVGAIYAIYARAGHFTQVYMQVYAGAISEQSINAVTVPKNLQEVPPRGAKLQESTLPIRYDILFQ
jgi:hypothetical protein